MAKNIKMKMSDIEQQLHKILIPIDGSDESFRAHFATRMAKKFGSELLLIHVIQVSPNLGLLGAYGAPSPDTIAEYLQTARSEPQSWFARKSKEASDVGVKVASQKIIEGLMSLVGEIVDYPQRNDADLISNRDARTKWNQEITPRQRGFGCSDVCSMCDACNKIASLGTSNFELP